MMEGYIGYVSAIQKLQNVIDDLISSHIVNYVVGWNKGIIYFIYD